jgi:hypothetical protein
VQPHGGAAGAAVVDEGHGARFGRDIFLEISHIEHARGGRGVGGFFAGRRIYPERGIGIVGRRHQDGSSHRLVIDGVACDGDGALGGGIFGIDWLCVGLSRVFCRSVFGGFLGGGGAKTQGEQKQQAGTDEAGKWAGILQG